MRLLLRAPVGIRLFLLADELADVVGGAGDHALRGGGHLAGRGEVEVVFLGEGIGLFLARFEDACEAVLGEAVEGLLERRLVEVGLFEKLAEIGLAVDQLEDLHQVLRKRRRPLVDLRDAFRGLRENSGPIHPSPRVACSPWL